MRGATRGKNSRHEKYFVNKQRLYKLPLLQILQITFGILTFSEPLGKQNYSLKNVFKFLFSVSDFILSKVFSLEKSFNTLHITYLPAKFQIHSLFLEILYICSFPLE
jgi:hypothetical protein